MSFRWIFLAAGALIAYWLVVEIRGVIRVWRRLHQRCPSCGRSVVEIVNPTDRNGHGVVRLYCSRCQIYGIPALPRERFRAK